MNTFNAISFIGEELGSRYKLRSEVKKVCAKGDKIWLREVLFSEFSQSHTETGRGFDTVERGISIALVDNYRESE